MPPPFFIGASARYFLPGFLRKAIKHPVLRIPQPLDPTLDAYPPPYFPDAWKVVNPLLVSHVTLPWSSHFSIHVLLNCQSMKLQIKLSPLVSIHFKAHPRHSSSLHFPSSILPCRSEDFKILFSSSSLLPAPSETLPLFVDSLFLPPPIHLLPVLSYYQPPCSPERSAFRANCPPPKMPPQFVPAFSPFPPNLFP